MTASVRAVLAAVTGVARDERKLERKPKKFLVRAPKGEVNGPRTLNESRQIIAYSVGAHESSATRAEVQDCKLLGNGRARATRLDFRSASFCREAHRHDPKCDARLLLPAQLTSSMPRSRDATPACWWCQRSNQLRLPRTAFTVPRSRRHRS